MSFKIDGPRGGAIDGSACKVRAGDLEGALEAMEEGLQSWPNNAGARFNAGQLAVYDQIDPELRELCEDVVLARRPDATERLLDIAFARDVVPV